MINMLGRGKEAGENRFLERAGEWAADLDLSDIPKEVRVAAGAQVCSTIGAAVWTHELPIAKRLLGSVESEYQDGVSTFIGGRQLAPTGAAYGNAALSMALDYDDAVLGAQLGHAAVFVPLAYAEATGASGERTITAVIAANEIASRLGSAAPTDPFRDWAAASVHAVAAAVGRAVIQCEDPDTITDAAALAVSQPSWPLDAAFFSEAKATTAAEQIERGCHAVAEARGGVDANRAIIETEGGFLERLADRQLPEFFGSLGDRWHTRAVTVKAHPGTASMAAPVEAALDIRHQLRDQAQVRIDRVLVETSLLTAGVDAVTRKYLDGPDSSLAAMNYSLPYNVAVALRAGRHTPLEFTPARTGDDQVWRLADKVETATVPTFTKAAIKSGVPLGLTLRRLGPTVVPYAIRAFGPVKTIRHLPTFLRFVRRRPLPTNLGTVAQRLGARVTVELGSGTKVTATCEHPTGFAGRPLDEVRGTARRKLRRGLVAAGQQEEDARTAAKNVESLETADSVSISCVTQVGG